MSQPIFSLVSRYDGPYAGQMTVNGSLIAARALLALNPDPTRVEVEEGLAGNLCRCAGYGQIIEAVLEAAAAGRNEP